MEGSVERASEPNLCANALQAPEPAVDLARLPEARQHGSKLNAIATLLKRLRRDDETAKAPLFASRETSHVLLLLQNH